MREWLEYERALLCRAWADTKADMEWSLRTVIIGAVTAIAFFGALYLLGGVLEVEGNIRSWLAGVLAVPFTGLAALLFHWTFAPLHLHQDAQNEIARLRAASAGDPARLKEMAAEFTELARRGQALLDTTISSPENFPEWERLHEEWRAGAQATFQKWGYEDWAFGFGSKKASDYIAVPDGVPVKDWILAMCDMQAQFKDFRGCAERILTEERRALTKN